MKKYHNINKSMEDGLIVVTGLILIIVSIFIIGKQQQKKKETFATSTSTTHNDGTVKKPSFIMTTAPVTTTEGRLINMNSLKKDLDTNGVLYNPKLSGSENNNLPAAIDMQSVSSLSLSSRGGTLSHSNLNTHNEGLVQDAVSKRFITEETINRYPSTVQIVQRERFANTVDPVTYRFQQDLPPDINWNPKAPSGSITTSKFKNRLKTDAGMKMFASSEPDTILSTYACVSADKCRLVENANEIQDNISNQSLNELVKPVDGMAPNFVKFEVVPAPTKR
jgi:hypothetical protein